MNVNKGFTVADRIRTLRLRDKDIVDALPGNPAEINWESAEQLVDAQFEKLLKGLVEILKEGYSDGDAEETRANIWKASRHEFGCELERTLTGESEPSCEALAPRES